MIFELLKGNDFDNIFDIMENSFPVTEIRTYEDQKNLLYNKLYKMYIFKNEREEIIAFMAVWEINDFIFVEHIALKESERGKGIGMDILKNFIEQQNKKLVILEVELPKTDIAERRIKFYKRVGFKLNKFNYLQPPLRKNNPLIPLLIMSYPHEIDETKFNYYKNELYKNVYKCQ